MTINECDEVKVWIEKITGAEKHYEAYYQTVRDTREYYRDAKSVRQRQGKYNIFWSTVETLKPFLYFKQPKPYVERNFKSGGRAERLACKILEKALLWDLGQFDFDSVIKYARNDFLISGTGIVWEQYKPRFEQFRNPAGAGCPVEIKTSEKVESVYVSPEYFLADCEKVGIWEDVSWIAKKIFMSKQDAVGIFGEEAAAPLIKEGEKDYRSREICVYEVWDKTSRRVLWVSKECPSHFLKVLDDPLHLSGFFPCPKPIFATLTNDSIIPVPDYMMIKEMLNELDGINNRMRLIMQSLKVSGCYDNAFPELAGILHKDVTLVSVNDFQRLKDSGGLRGIIDFMPIEQYVGALEQLSKRRQDVIAAIFDVTGVSDIMRGTSNAAETATAVTQKTNFGTLRNQDRQNDMQRFIRDLFRIKAEIICEQFAPETLLGFLSAEEAALPEAQTAVHLLKTEKIRGMLFGVENDASFNQEREHEKSLSGIKTISELIASALGTVSVQPLLLPLYRQMIETAAAALPKTRPFESVLEKVFADVEAELFKPETPQPDLRQNEAKRKNDLKERELNIKEQSERNKVLLANKEMMIQAWLKNRQLNQKECRHGKISSTEA